MELVVQAESVQAKAVQFEGLVHRNKWPAPGMTLPVTVDATNPQAFRVEWDEVSSSRERSHAAAEGLAAALRGEGPGAGVSGAAGVNVVNLSGRDLSQLSDEQKAKLRMLGIDPDALAAQQDAATSPPPSPEADEPVDDQLGRLERLGHLREQGVLTEQEFAEQKRRILDADA
jgi:hypothetical protein